MSTSNLPPGYRGEDNYGVGECCELCGDPLTTHKCCDCGELLECDDCGVTDTQTCSDCKVEAERIGKALDGENDNE